MRIAEPWGRADRTGVDSRAMLVALFACFAYYFGAKVGFALTFQPYPISTLWPPNAILLAALLLLPSRSWWLPILAALPAHIAGELQSGVPATMVAAWFASNCSEALIGAVCVKWLIKGDMLRFDSFRHVGVFLVCGVFLGPFLSSFLDAGFVTLVGWGEGSYWQLWRTRFFSNALTALTIVPVIITWVTGGLRAFRQAPLALHVEAGVFTLGLLAVSVWVFGADQVAASPVLLYAPFPFLLIWAAVRLGPAGTSGSLLVITFLAIWGAIHGHGPFVATSPTASALSVQLFLLVLAIPQLLLAAMLEERKKADKALTEKQEQLQLALGAARIGTWVWDIGNNNGTWSEESRRIFGIDAAERLVTLDAFSSLVHPADRTSVLTAIRRTATEGTPYQAEFRIVRPDGGTRWVMSKGQAHFDNAHRPERVLGVNVDTTELNLAAEALRKEAAMRESEARFRELADSLPQIVWAARPDGCVDYLNRRWYEVTGAAKGKIGDESWIPLLHPKDRERGLEIWHEALRKGEAFEMEYRLLFDRTGLYRWHLARAIPVRDDSGGIVRWNGTATDIDERKRAEQSLREMEAQLEERVEERTAALSRAHQALEEEVAERKKTEGALRSAEERFAKTFRSSMDAYVLLSGVDRSIVDVNERWQSMLGYGRAEAIGRTLAQIGASKDGEPDVVLDQVHSHGYVRDFELKLRTKSGEARVTLVAADRLDIEGRASFILIIRDVTDQRRLEREAQEQRNQMTHLTRVAVLGELTGALAHELNQPLTAILTNAQATQLMLARDKVDLDEVREVLQDIVEDDKRASEVIRRLRGLLKRGETQTQLLDVNALVREALGLAQSHLGARGIDVEAALSESLPLLRGDRVQLEQVILNMIMNACDEMTASRPDNRRLTIVTEATPDATVRISVADSGPGIDPDHLEALFAPFFTTKEQGLGLGLSVSRSIVTAHGGQIWAENVAGGGAKFVVALPQRKKPIGLGVHDR